MSDFHDNFFVITGAPYAGKTTLLQCLEDRQFTIMAEAGHAIVQDQTVIGGKALPWEDRLTYAELMLNWDIRSYREAPGQGRPVLFDRGIPDIIGYLELNGLPVPAHFTNAATRFRYHKKVFVAPYWEEIHNRDTTQKHTRDEARAVHDATVRVYERLGYELLPLPTTSLDQRIRFITIHLDGLKKSRTVSFA